MKRMLLVGASGLVGRELVDPLRQAGFEVVAVARNINSDIGWSRTMCGDVFDKDFVVKIVREVRPTHLLNLAWCTTGDYLTSGLNQRFLETGLTLAHEFVAVGGRRAVYVGSCFEYDLNGHLSPIKESDPLDVEKNAYTRCKNELRQRASAIFSEGGVSFAYGRIFYVYGKNEPPTRLTGMVMDKLRRGEAVVIKAGPLVKDYIYAKDVAGGLSALVESDVCESVNICTGRGIMIRDYVLKIANRMGRPDLVKFNDDCSGQPAEVIGDNTRLRSEVGYVPSWSYDDAINEIISCS